MLSLRDLHIAFANANLEDLLEAIDENLHMIIIGHMEMEGSDEFRDFLIASFENPVSELTVDHILTHGKEGMASGQITFANGDGFSFCNIFTFTNAKGAQIKAIKSFVIPNVKL